MEETRVHQVHGGMLDAASISVDRHPVVVLGLIERAFSIFGGQVAQVIPRGTHERIHRIGLAQGLPAAHRAFGLFPGWVQFQWAFTGGLPLHILRQQHWQFPLRYWVPAVLLAVDHRDRCAPIALA